MADYVEKYSDKASDKLEKQIRRVYKQAAEEVQKKLDDFIRGHKARNAQMLQMVSDGKMSKQDYQRWMRGQVFQGDQWKQKLKDVTDVYVHADEKAREIVGGTSKNVFMEAANYTAYDLEKGMRGAVAFNVYDAKTVERLLKKDPKMLPEWKIDQPKDYKWNEKRVRNAVAQGIIQGESVEEVGDRLTGELATSNATKMDMFARTAINGAQNAGRMDRLHEAEEMGIEVRKKWLATLDQRTRDTHQALDGQEQPIDEPFVVDGMKIDYPGDPFAPPELVYNCRCTLTYVYPKYQHLQHNHERRDQLNDKNIENMTYYEWVGLASKNDRKQDETPVQKVEKKPTPLIGGDGDAEITDNIRDYFLPKTTRSKLDEIESLSSYNEFKRYMQEHYGIELDTHLESLKGARANESIEAVNEECRKIIVAIDAYRGKFGDDALSSLRKVVLYDKDLDTRAAYFFNRIGENDPLAGEIHFRQWGDDGRTIFHELAHAYQDSNKRPGEDAVTFSERIIKEMGREDLKAYTGAKKEDYAAEQIADAFGFGFSQGIKNDLEFIDQVEKETFKEELKQTEEAMPDLPIQPSNPRKSVEQKSEYTKSEEEAIHEYTTSSYSGVNSALREGTVDNYKDVKDIVDKIDSAMEKTVVNDGTVTSRGASMADLRGMFEGKRRSWFEDPDNLKSLEGQTASFKSYLSTTKGDTVAEPYKRELQWHFTTEGQVHGIDAEQFASSSVKSEREIVFDRDSQIEIEKVKVNVDSDGDIDGVVEIWAKIKGSKQEEQTSETKEDSKSIEITDEIRKQVSKSTASDDWFEYDYAKAMSEYIKTGEMPTRTLFTFEDLSQGIRRKLAAEAELIQETAEKTKTEYKTTYRGMVLSEEDVKALKTGSKHTFDTLTASTPDKKLASVYTDVGNNPVENGVPVIFEIQKPDGIYAFDREKGTELVLPRGSTFRIERKYTDEDGVVHISLYSKKGNNIIDMDADQPAEKPQKKEKEESKQTEETTDVSYQYHATTAKAIIGIAEKGLQPNRGHVGKGIYFADSAKDALDWVDTTSTGGKTVLRISEEYLKKEKLEKYSANETGYGLAESVYNGNVPLEHIQIKVNDNGDEDDWWSLAEYLKNRKSQYNMLDSKTKKKVDEIVSEETDRRLEKLESKDEPQLSKHTVTAIDDYIEGRGNKFTKTEVEEIKTNMTKTGKTLYRVEDLSWMAESLEDGDKFEFDKPIKSFTHSYKSIKDVIAEGMDAGLYESDVLVIYETVDDTYQLDVSSMSRNHAEEEESFVSGKFEVVDQGEGDIINGVRTWRILIRQIRK